MNQQQIDIDHEVRIRLIEELAKQDRIDMRGSIKEVKADITDIRTDIKEAMRHMDNKIDNQFKWIMGTMLTLFGGIILHMAKLI